MVDDDLILADQIRLAGAAQDIQVEVATDLAMARHMIGQLAPDLIVLDLSFPNPTEDGLSLLQELATRVPRIPTIVFTKRESLADRITAARLGSYAFLHKPLPADQILNLITTALSPKQQFSSENRVMVVDDDQALLTLLSGLLTAAGIVVATIAYPQQFWSVLTDFQPHLLVVDLKMPELNGVELCQVVRHDPAWDRLAILLLSAHSTVETIDQAFAAGANDFINKTVGPSEIVNRIVRRLAWGQRGSTINLKSG
jgi:DNA-binding response OmpR family regulator